MKGMTKNFTNKCKKLYYLHIKNLYKEYDVFVVHSNKGVLKKIKEELKVFRNSFNKVKNEWEQEGKLDFERIWKLRDYYLGFVRIVLNKYSDLKGVYIYKESDTAISKRANTILIKDIYSEYFGCKAQLYDFFELFKI